MKSWKAALLATATGIVAGTLLRRQMPPVYDFRGKTVVITGGSRGLGLEMARVLASEGARIAICSRTASEVEWAVSELRGYGVDVLGGVCDVTQAEEVAGFIDRVVAQWGSIDVLINNAGVIMVGPEECLTKEDYETSLNTHFWGPLHAIRAVLPSMRSRRQGRIVNIASIGGKISVPHLVSYSAGKFALVGLSEGLTSELAPEGILVTTACPGVMATGSPRHALFKGKHRAEYGWFSIGASLPVLATDSTTAARRIVEACRNGDRQVSSSWIAQGQRA